MNKKKLVNVSVLNKEIAVVCPEEQKAELFAAAAYLDKKMRDVRNTSKTMELDRIAITAALNIAHELLILRQQPLSFEGSLSANKVIQQSKLNTDNSSSNHNLGDTKELFPEPFS